MTYIYLRSSSLSILSDWVPVSLDDKTAQKLLWISEGGSKVARTSDAVCPYPNRPERYEHSPQVSLAVVMPEWLSLSNYNQTKPTLVNQLHGHTRCLVTGQFWQHQILVKRQKQNL